MNHLSSPAGPPAGEHPEDIPAAVRAKRWQYAQASRLARFVNEHGTDADHSSILDEHGQIVPEAIDLAQAELAE
jgi:hypothetical protein